MCSFPFIILVDTREQTPWVFQDYEILRQALPVGDYSIMGCESSVVIERKSLHDFVQTIIHNRERFGKECKTLSQMPHVCIIVEGSIEDVKRHRYKSRAKPGSVLAIAESLERKYGIPIVWAGNRYGAICKATEWLELGWEKYGG